MGLPEVSLDHARNAGGPDSPEVNLARYTRARKPSE